MKRIRVAQIGTGHDHALATINVLKRNRELFDIAGFCFVPEDDWNLPEMTYEKNSSAYEGIRQLTLEDILSDDEIQAVFIETEDRALTKYAIMAAEKGKHIHMDKPGGIDSAEFEHLIDIVSEKQLVFHVGYMYRYNPAVQKLKEDIQAGKLGEVLSVEAQMNCAHGIKKRNWMGSYPGGMLYYLGCHMIDLVYSIMGEPLEVIPLSCSSGVDGTMSEDFGMAVYRYQHGISFAKSTAIEIGGFERRQLVVVGTKGTVELCPFEWLGGSLEGVFAPQTTGVREVFFENWHKKGEYHELPTFGRYDGMFRAFAEYVNGEAVNPFDYEYERNLHRLILKSCGK